MGIHIFKGNTTFKIEFKSTEIASNFLNNINTEIGGIRILQKHKETAVDTTIHQCWGCGRIDTEHTSQNCPGHKICLKCGDSRHELFNCPLPKRYENMNTIEKNARFCILCGTRGDHSSIDPFCPHKRHMIQNRIKEARSKRSEFEQAHERCNITQNTCDFSDNNTWPSLNTPTQQKKYQQYLC